MRLIIQRLHCVSLTLRMWLLWVRIKFVPGWGLVLLWIHRVWIPSGFCSSVVQILRSQMHLCTERCCPEQRTWHAPNECFLPHEAKLKEEEDPVEGAMINRESLQREGWVPRPAPQTTQQDIVGTRSDWNTVQVEAPIQAQLILGAVCIVVNVIVSKAASSKPF